MPTDPIVISLQICPEAHQPMTPIESAHAVENLGLEGDRHAKLNSKRQVLLIEAETLERLSLRAGDLKENITTRGIVLMTLSAGTRLHVGEAILEISGECYPCERMEELRPGLRQMLSGQRGVLARVAQSGTLRVGDSITVEASSA